MCVCTDVVTCVCMCVSVCTDVVWNQREEGAQGVFAVVQLPCDWLYSAMLLGHGRQPAQGKTNQMSVTMSD